LQASVTARHLADAAACSSVSFSAGITLSGIGIPAPRAVAWHQLHDEPQRAAVLHVIAAPMAAAVFDDKQV
jgi:hypothetical protein